MDLMSFGQLPEPLTGKVWTLDEFESYPALLVRFVLVFDDLIVVFVVCKDHCFESCPALLVRIMNFISIVQLFGYVCVFVFSADILAFVVFIPFSGLDIG